MITDKMLFLSKIYAIKRTIEQLPEDVTICGINVRFDAYKPREIQIHILEHPLVTGKRVKDMGGGEWWCENPGDVYVGWIEEDCNGPVSAEN